MHVNEDDLQYYVKIIQCVIVEKQCVYDLQVILKIYIYSIYAFHVVFLECADPAAVLFTVESVCAAFAVWLYDLECFLILQKH